MDRDQSRRPAHLLPRTLALMAFYHCVSERDDDDLDATAGADMFEPPRAVAASSRWIDRRERHGTGTCTIHYTIRAGRVCMSYGAGDRLAATATIPI
jgi:hypothetical protein